MPAKRGDSQFDYPDYAEFHLRCNPGYDFIRFVGWLDQAPPEKFNHVFAAYARNPLGVIIASCAIEGYINYVGQELDREWDQFTKERNSVRDRIERIYSILKKPAEFGSGVMQQVIELFQMRRRLVHPLFQDTHEERSSPPPNLFDHVDADFPAAKSRKIAESFATRSCAIRSSKIYGGDRAMLRSKNQRDLNPRPNQSMKPTAPLPGNFSELAMPPVRGLSLSR